MIQIYIYIYIYIYTYVVCLYVCACVCVCVGVKIVCRQVTFTTKSPGFPDTYINKVVKIR